MNQETPDSSDTTSEEAGRREPEHPLFKLVIVSSAAFLLTVLSMVAAMMGSGEAPLAKFINRNGVRMIAVEVVLIIVFGILAMAADRRRTLLNQQRDARVATESGCEQSGEPGIDTDGQGDKHG
ncbi:MAG: hypothetical protein ACYTGL_04470 [Planctomycetota bacterium]